MAEASVNLGALQHKAKLEEREHDWVGAAETYSEAARLVSSNDPLRLGNLSEARAHALYRYAFQADSVDEFKSRLAQALRQYDEAKEAYDRLAGKKATAWTYRCDAMISFLRYWQEPGPAEKKRLMEDAWTQAISAMDAFERIEEYVEFGKTNSDLTFGVSVLYAYSIDVKLREELVRGALKYSEKAIKLLEEGEGKAERAKACMNASYYTKIYYTDFVETDKRGEWDKRSGGLFRQALKLSEEGIIDALSYSFIVGGLPSSLPEEELADLRRKVLDFSAKTKDKLRIGNSIEWLENHAAMMAYGAADSEEMLSNADQALAYAEQAARAYGICSYHHVVDAAFWSASPKSGYYALTASLENDLPKKRELALRGVDAFKEYIRSAEACAYPQVVAAAHWDGAKILIHLAKTDKSPVEKSQTLESALHHANQHIVSWHSLFPNGDFFLASGKAVLADIKHELADLAADPSEKARLYHEAVSDISDAYAMLARDVDLYSGSPEIFCRIYQGVYQYQLADWSMQLYSISKDRKDAVLAAEAFTSAVDLYKRAGQPSRVAESQWKAAQAYDALGDPLGSSERFVMASSSYRQAADEVPRLSNLYREYGLYMQAWSQIELARHHHARQEGREASECYEKASSLYESTDRWRFLAPNYRAWASVEEGEDLSRREKSMEAKEAFGKAAELFGDARKSLSGRLDTLENLDERENAEKLVKAADLRREYCGGRLALEEAKILDKQGDEFGSCERFGKAAERFESLHAILESDQDKRETQLIMTLTRAWQMMVRAEAEASPELYDQAAQIFERAKDLSVGEKAKQLAMGHSRFCKALAAGTKFADTADTSLHAVATQNLESAANHYLMAGLERDSMYASASKLLFDAYVYMNKANSEEDQSKKARLYAMTEKMLEASAASYLKAEYPKKKDQVMKLLEKVRSERELALTLMEVLHAPDIVENTKALPAPVPSHDTPAGMQRFERAEIQSTMFAKPKELHVGQEFSLEIELTNAGRGVAQLTSIESVIPDGFEIVTEPERCRVEEGHLNMKGRRIEALATEDIEVKLKPIMSGDFTFRPKITYLDDSGARRLCEPKPVELTVRELGLVGWIKGRDDARK